MHANNGKGAMILVAFACVVLGALQQLKAEIVRPEPEPEPCSLDGITGDPAISVQLDDWCRAQVSHTVVLEGLDMPFVDFVANCIDNYDQFRLKGSNRWCATAAVDALRMRYAHDRQWYTVFDVVTFWRPREEMHAINEAQLDALADIDTQRRYLCDILAASPPTQVRWFADAQRRWNTTYC